MLHKCLTNEERDAARGIAEIKDIEARQRGIVAWEKETGKKFPRFIYGADLDELSGDRNRRIAQQAWDSTINKRKK